MTLRDDSTPGSLYPLLLSAKQSKDMKTLDRHSESFFKLRYDQNPLEKGHGDHYVDIRILPVEYVHNPEAIGAVAKFFSRPDDDDEAIEMIKSVAEDTLKDLRAQTQAGLEQILLQRKTTVLRIDAEAPVIVVPDSVTRADAPIVILDMGRLTVDSEPVDADLKEMVRDHGEASLPESEYQRLKESMYDRYVCKLTAVQVVTGRDFAVCVDQLVAINPDPAYHVFDRINLELAVEACLLPREPDLTKLKLGLGVEKLHLNFSDRKYKRIMRAIQLLIGADELAGGRETGANLHLPKETVARERHMRSRSLSEMVLPRMTSVGASLEDLLPDATVEGGEEGFFDAPEVPFALPLGAYDVERVTGRDEPGHVAVDFSLAVDSMSATVRRTDRAALNTRSVDEPGTILAELSVTNFGVRVLVRPLDLGVKVHVGNVQIIDRMQSYGPAFDVLLQSKTDAENLGQGKEGKHFVAVTYRGFQREHPEYAGVDHEVAVDFASVTLMLTPDSLLEIQDFVLATFGSDSGAQLPTSAPSPLLESKSAGSAEARSNGVVDVRISMDSIVLAVNRRGAMIASGSVAKGALNIRLNEASMVVNGRLGSFVIEDHMRRREAFANFVSFAGDQVAEFTYVTYDPRSVDYPGYDSFIELTTESVRIVYLEYLLSALLDWLGDLNRARVAMEIARLSAANSAAFIQETSGRMRFLVKIKTPIIILPRPAETSNDMLEAHLGEITCSNRYLVGSGNAVSTGRRFETINEITLDVQKMRLWSSIYLDSGKTFEQRLAMIRDLSWKMTLRLNEGVQDAVIPAMAVDADLGDASARMTEKQYALLLEVLDNILSPSDHTDPTANEHAPPPELDLPDNNEQSLASSDRGNDPSIFIALDVSVSISTLGLEIFVADSMDTGESALETTGLAEFLINGITINASISNQGDLMLETVMNSFSVKDTRVNNASIFREVVPSNRYGKNQLVIQYTRDRKGATDVALAIDGLLSILSVRYVFDLWAFFMMPKYFDRTAYAPETVASAPPESKSAEDKVDDASAAQPPLSYRINLVDAEIIILGDPTAKDTEAIVLAANQIFLSQDATLVLAFKQAGLFLINMDRRQENRFRIVSSFDMALRQQISSREHRLTIDVSPNRALEIRVSYRDFALFTKLSRLVADISGGNEPSPSPGLPSAGPRSIAFSPPDSSQNADATSKHETLELNLGGLEAVLIDDVSDPMIQMINVCHGPGRWGSV